MSGRHLALTAAAVTATVVAGGLGTDVRSDWYADLDKPDWQPAAWVFGPAWRTLYGLIAVGGARALDRAGTERRVRFAVGLGVNLALDTPWSWRFFPAKRPRW